MVAAKNHDVAFVVSLAGPGVTGAVILKTQVPASFRLNGGGDECAEALSQCIEEVVQAFQTHSERIPEAELDKILKKYEEVSANGNEIEKAMAPAIRQTMKGLDTKWTRFFIDHDPVPVLKNVKCPVLALNGEKGRASRLKNEPRRD